MYHGLKKTGRLLPHATDLYDIVITCMHLYEIVFLFVTFFFCLCYLEITHNSGRVQLLLDLCLIAAAEFHMQPMNQQQEKRIIEDICHRYDASLASETAAGFKHGPPGTWWALISTQWWRQWRLFVGYDNDMSEMPSSSSSFTIPPPGTIKNRVLLKSELQLVASLRHGIDYDCLPPSAWECLQWWYGGGPSIQREVVRIPQPQHLDVMMNLGNDEEEEEEGLLRQPLVPHDHIELYPLLLKVTFCNAKGHPLRGGRYLLFSKFATGQDLLEHISAINKLEPERMRLWNYVDRADWHSQSLLDLQRLVWFGCFRHLITTSLCFFPVCLLALQQQSSQFPPLLLLLVYSGHFLNLVYRIIGSYLLKLVNQMARGHAVNCRACLRWQKRKTGKNYLQVNIILD